MKIRVAPQPGLDSIPPYKPGRSIEEIQRQYGIQDVIKLASNENPLGASPKALAVLSQAFTKVNFYPDGQCFNLRNALACKLDVKPDQIIVGNGEDGLILETCMAFLDENSQVIVSKSSFPVYDIYSGGMRARVVKTPMKNYCLDLDAMAAAITGQTKLIFVCNPNNPTGTTVSSAEVNRFLERVPDHVLVIFDEAYLEYVDEPNFPDALSYVREGRENVVVMRTFSKIYGLAGLRLGYAIGSAATLAQLYCVKEPFSVNMLAQIAGEAALDDDEFLERTLLVNRSGRKYLYKEFDRLDLSYLKTQANFILVELGPRAAQIVESLMQKGVIIRPCVAYDLPAFARISIGSAEQNERLIKTLEEVMYGRQ
jgi:histidinol-phosphate aminotransferase